MSPFWVLMIIWSVLEIPTGSPVWGRQLWRRTGNFLLIFLQFYVYDLRFKAWGPTTFFIFLLSFKHCTWCRAQRFRNLWYHMGQAITPNQWWLGSWILRNKLQWNLCQNIDRFFIYKTIFENVCQMAIILFQTQSDKTLGVCLVAEKRFCSVGAIFINCDFSDGPLASIWTSFTLHLQYHRDHGWGSTPSSWKSHPVPHMLFPAT